MFSGSQSSLVDLRSTFGDYQLTCTVLWDQTKKYYDFWGHNLIAPRIPSKLKVFTGILPVLEPN